MDAIPMLQAAVALFAIAAAGGLVMAGIRLLGGLMFVHAGLAVVAFVLLCIAAFRGPP